MNSKSIIKNVVLSRKRLIFSLIFIILFSVSLRIANPLIIRNLINDVVVDGIANPSKVVFFGVMIAVFTLLNFLFDSQRIVKSSVFGNDITTALSERAYSTLLRSELLELTKLDHENIVNKITTKTSTIGNEYFAKKVIPFIYEGILILGLSVTLLVINYWFFLLTFITLPLFYFITKQVTKLIDKSDEKVKRNEENNLRLLRENLKQIKNIKLLNGIKAEEEKYNKLIKKVQRSYRKEYSLHSYNSGMVNNLLVDLIYSGVMGIGAWIILQTNEYATIGAMLASVMVIPQIFPSFRRIMDLKIMPHYIADEINEIDELLVLKPENRADTVQQLDEIYSLKFKDVAYDYGTNSKFTMENINFEIKKGEKLGILGLGSSGKTTISDLITKIIRPKQGSVLINNCDLNKVNSYYLRELISVVPQNFKLFNGTIENNITYPLPFDEYKYNDALNKCRLKSVISTIDKKDQAIVSDNTDMLTVAEKQRVALANAFYKDAKIFVLDEATSKLDHNTESDIMNEIYKLKNKIILVISNRIYNLTKCDKILILNNGRIIEYGKTSDLLDDSKSTFARMMNEYEQSKVRVG
jgi:ATP-binding cassette subfamily B protein